MIVAAIVTSLLTVRSRGSDAFEELLGAFRFAATSNCCEAHQVWILATRQKFLGRSVRRRRVRYILRSAFIMPMETSGIEPPTSGLQNRRSPD